MEGYALAGTGMGLLSLVVAVMRLWGKAKKWHKELTDTVHAQRVEIDALSRRIAAANETAHDALNKAAASARSPTEPPARRTAKKPADKDATA